MLVQLYAAEMPETHFTALAPGIIDTNMQDHIYNLPEDERFPVLAKLRKAKGTPDMPDPVKASKMLAQKIDQVKDHPSGSFLDVRTM
jgi:NAD(P)-dependent dehydrogenase (short-subunit alcohol dehydrogenase family)